MERDLYEELKSIEFKPMTFRLYNKIDDDMIPYSFGKKNNQTYGIDDFEYCKIPLDKKESFLLSIHNKEFLKKIGVLKSKIGEKDCVIDVNFNDNEINVIKLKETVLD